MSRSLTYAELGELLGITAASANKLARRKRWPRAKGNDGKTRVSVPDESLDRPQDSPGDGPPDCPADVPPDSPPNMVHELQARIAVLEVEVGAERRRADAAEADRDAWREQAQRLVERQGERRRGWFGRR